MINSVRQTTAAILNKNNRGYIPVSDFNHYCYISQLEIFKDWFIELNAVINKINRRKSHTGLSDRRKSLEDRIELFAVKNKLTRISNNIFSLPTVSTLNHDYHKILTLNYINPSDGSFISEINKVGQYKASIIASSMDMAPTEHHPIYTQQGTKATVLPATISEENSVECVYIKNPSRPNWTYKTLMGGEPIFDQTSPDFQDFELPDDEFDNLVEKILQYSGMSIDAIRIARFGKSEEMQDKAIYQRQNQAQ